jgi:hypothetical protein
MLAGRLLLTLSLALAYQSEAPAGPTGPHSITYAKRVEPLGTQVTLGGATFDLVRIPVGLFSGKRYALIVPATRFDPDFGLVYIGASHSTEPFESNITIDTFPAHVRVDEVQSYSLAGDLGTSATFNVGTYIGLSVTIKLGTTRLSYVVQLDRDAILTEADIGADYNAVPYAEWAKYRHPSDLVKAVNDLLDYIRVIPL